MRSGVGADCLGVLPRSADTSLESSHESRVPPTWARSDTSESGIEQEALQNQQIPTSLQQQNLTPSLETLWLKMLPQVLSDERPKLQFSRKQGQTCTSTSRFSTSDQVRHQLLKNVSCTDWVGWLVCVNGSFDTLFLFRTRTGTRMGRSGR